LKTVAVSGGAPEVLCEAHGAEHTGTWGKSDDIIFSTGEVLLRVPAAGGSAEPLTSLNISRAETGHVYPAFLPDGRHFLYSVRSQQTADRAIYIGTLGSKDATKLLPLVSPIYFSSGKLLYVDNGSLVARGFDADSLKFTGEPIRIAGQAAPRFTVSDQNVLIYQVGAPQVARTFQYSWVDANGKLIGLVGKPETYLPYWDLSPDGKKAAVSLFDGEPPAAHVWVLDLERGISSRITTGADTGAAPRWSGDGQRIAYVTQQKGNRDIFARSASGLGSSEELLNSPEPETLDDWSPDSRYILYRIGANTNTIYALPLFGERKPIKVVESEFNKAKSHLSADGKWLAYQAIESGGSQIYVVSFPKADQKRQISTAGGVQPQWRPDGRGLYFLSVDGKMMSVDIITEPALSSETPRPLFDTGIAAPSFDSEEYATADGKRFLFLKLIPAETSNAAAPPPTIVVYWTTGLKDQKSK
jgi:Tol biopolymer transport system component